jgi:PAS domain S-box-containing protein
MTQSPSAEFDGQRSLVERLEERVARLEAELAAQRGAISPDELLQRHFEEFRTLMDILPIGVCIADDPDCRQMRINAEFARLLGISPEVNISHTPPPGEFPPFELFKDGEPVPGDALPMQTAVRELRQIHNFEVDAVFPDGRRVAMLVNAAPLFNAHGEARGAIAVVWDVTERKDRDASRRRLEQEHQAQKFESLSALAGSIAHDFTNWLTVIRSYTSLVALAVPPSSPQEEQVARIEQAAHDAAALCRRLLTYAGMSPLEPVEVDLCELVRNLVDLVRPALSPHAEVHLVPTDQSFPVAGDPAQLKQVVMNLLTNASDALGDEPGDIDLRLAIVHAGEDQLARGVIRPIPAPGEFVQLEVQDTGCGVPSELIPRLFEPFFTTKFRGHGVGLPSLAGIVRNHQGTVLIDSTVGQGTTFAVLLPRWIAHPLGEGASQPAD